MYSSNNLIVVDDGGFSTCVVTDRVRESFPSVKGYLGERRLTQIQSKHDFIVEYNGEQFALGTLAKYDCATPVRLFSESKQHLFYDLSVLTAIHQYGYSQNNVILTVPISSHTPEEKQGRADRLKGQHSLKINGVTKTFDILDVKVAPESATAFWINKQQGKSKWLDLGSRTVGFSTVYNIDNTVRFIDSQSGTMAGKGIEALSNNYNPKGLADYICGSLSRFWDKSDVIHLLGGGCHDTILVNEIKKYFPNAVVMDNPTMVNALGCYELGRIVYGNN